MSGEVEPGEILFPLWWVARALGWTTELTRDRFVRAGIVMKPPGATEWSIMRSALMSRMPLVVERIDQMHRNGELKKVRKNRGSPIAQYKISSSINVPRNAATRSRHGPV